MGDPRNPKRIDELWNPVRLAVLEREARVLGRIGTISGGFAWHFMSPPHEERKILHDHKDIDVLITPNMFPEVITTLQRDGYQKVWTKYDRISTNFHRYERDITYKDERVKVQIDLFLQKVPRMEVNGVWLVEPSTLLSFYKAKIHQTDDCTAVIAARSLLARGIYPVGRPELIGEEP